MKKTILIIEDEPATMQALMERFSHNGFTVLQAKDGQEGLKISLEKHPDLILLDIIMPKMDGMEMLKQLRKDDWGKTANVVILTNLTDPQKVSEAMEKQVYDFWVKADWQLDDLAKAVKKRIK